MKWDHYAWNLARAAWGWMEDRVWYPRGYRKTRKDRRMGRAEKRSARQADRRDIEREWEP